MGFSKREPTTVIDLFLKRGSDLTQTIAWPPVGAPTDFTGAAARMPIFVDGQGDVLNLTNTTSPFGGIVLGTLGLGTSGQIVVTITKAATQALWSVCMQRAPYSFYVDWANSTTTCLFAGTAFLSDGSPI